MSATEGVTFALYVLDQTWFLTAGWLVIACLYPVKNPQENRSVGLALLSGLAAIVLGSLAYVFSGFFVLAASLGHMAGPSSVYGLVLYGWIAPVVLGIRVARRQWPRPPQSLA